MSHPIAGLSPATRHATAIQWPTVAVAWAGRGLREQRDGRTDVRRTRHHGAAGTDFAPHGPVFGWPYHLCTLYAHFRRLQSLAEIPPERRRWMKFHGLRKLHATKADELGGLLAQISLGHTTARTTAEHYTDHAAQMRRLATMLPAPRAALAREDGRQLRLFD